MLHNNFPLSVLWREMSDWRHEVDRFLARGAVNGTSDVALNVWEDDHHYYVAADLPAIDLAKLDVTVTEGNQLTIQGERLPVEPPGAVWHRQERATGAFKQGLTLPLPVNADAVQATYEQGVLQLVLPKSEAAKPRKIAVRAAGDSLPNNN